MKDFKIKKSDVVNFWKNYGNYTFFGLSLLCAALVVPLMWCNNLIFWLGVIASFIIFLRLELMANIEIEDAFVRGGWAFINLSLFTATFWLCRIGDIIDLHFIGCFVYIFLGTFLYTDIIPRVSYFLGLNDKNEGYDYDLCGSGEKTKSNGWMLSSIIYVLILGIVCLCEFSKEKDILFEKEPFVQVTKWEKEFHSGNTYYLVYCPKGRFLISLAQYPEIRDINPNTKIKVLKGGGGLNGTDYFTRLEIKN